MIVIIDNYDSFTYNLYQYIGEFNLDIKVFRNDQITIADLEQLDISHIVLSPGPGYPENSGISKDIVRRFGKQIPILGICLGHQIIGEVFGAKVSKAERMLHGKTSMIEHEKDNLFELLKQPFVAMRYHSLIVKSETFPKALVVIAKSEEGEIMALKHKDYQIYGLQFHPESIGTPEGKKIIKNFLKIGKEHSDVEKYNQSIDC